jgi:hypothetical protein
MRWLKSCSFVVVCVSVGCSKAAPDPDKPADLPLSAAPAQIDKPAAALPDKPTPPDKPSAAEYVPYGAPLAAQPGSERDLTALVTNPDAHGGEPVTVNGVVRQVCQQRGCWLELAADTAPDAVGCRVISQQHAFFVPRDAVGNRARVQGKVEVKTVSAAQVAHMEAEGGHFAAKQPDGSARELMIVASGVELAKGAAR